MRKALFPLVVILGVLLAGCGTPPPLRSDKYLNDRTFISQEPCGPPCFHDIIIGQTTFADALGKLRGNGLFKDVESQDSPRQAVWKTKDGEACCQLTADEKTGLVDAILVRVAPVMTLKEVIEKYGTPAYVSVLPNDYSETEVALGLIYPKTGNVIWVMPGDAKSTIDENDPVVIILYLNPAKFDELLATATLQGWDGYKEYSFYRTVTPALTPRVTLTPSQ